MTVKKSRHVFISPKLVKEGRVQSRPVEAWKKRVQGPVGIFVSSVSIDIMDNSLGNLLAVCLGSNLVLGVAEFKFFNIQKDAQYPELQDYQVSQLQSLGVHRLQVQLD